MLAGRGYPSERCAASSPVSVLQGQAVLVTELVPSVPRSERREASIGPEGSPRLPSVWGGCMP